METSDPSLIVNIYPSRLFENANKSLDGAILVSSHQGHLSVDKRVLYSLGIQRIKEFDACGAAIKFIIKHRKNNIVIVDERLSDMTGHEFICTIRKVRKLKSTPLIMATAENRKETILEAISAGCSGYLIRPYSIEALIMNIRIAISAMQANEIDEEQLALAKEYLDQGKVDNAVGELEEFVESENEATSYFDMGTKHLMASRYGKAIVSFGKAVRINEMYAEAFKGLAHAYQGKGQRDKYLAYLKKAAEILAADDKMAEAKTIFIEILRNDPAAINPYNDLGIRLREKGDLSNALHAYFKAIELSPSDDHIYYNIAKAYLFMRNVDKAGEYIEKSLKMNPDFKDAQSLYLRLSGNSYTSKSFTESREHYIKRPMALDLC